MIQAAQSSETTANEFSVNHSSSMDGTANKTMIFNRPDLNGSGNLNSSIKMNSGNIAVTQGKSSVRSSVQRQTIEEKQ